MTNPEVAEHTDAQLTYQCAYSLPAVVLTLGREHFHMLKSTIETLVFDVDYLVRRTLANSLHELAVILGPDITTQYLLPMFDWFLKDEDEVKIYVLKHLADFLKVIFFIRTFIY